MVLHDSGARLLEVPDPGLAVEAPDLRGLLGRPLGPSLAPEVGDLVVVAGPELAARHDGDPLPGPESAEDVGGDARLGRGAAAVCRRHGRTALGSIGSGAVQMQPAPVHSEPAAGRT